MFEGRCRAYMNGQDESSKQEGGGNGPTWVGMEERS